MATKASGQSGYDFEELLRAYFLRAGFYVLRGVPVKFVGDDATDMDIWLYERPTGTMRRRQVVDAKFKARPKASERIVWAKGLEVAFGLDGAVVATTDKRASLRVLAKRAGVTLFDGNDLERIKSSPKLQSDERVTEEQFLSQVRAADALKHSKDYMEVFMDVKSYVSTDFGPTLVNRALDAFGFFARESVTSHQGSSSAITLGRLAFLTSSLVAIGLDFVAAENPFQSASERREAILSVIRYGTFSKEEGIDRLKIASALARKYAPNGSAIAAQITAGFTADLAAIPAEIIAEQAVKMAADSSLFSTARTLEAAAYGSHPPNFDQLPIQAKSLLGAALDFSDVKRESFASAWSRSPGYVPPSVSTETSAKAESLPGDLFGGK